MQNRIKFKLGSYNFSCIYENGSLKPIGKFSKLSSIPINSNMKLHDFIDEVLKKFEEEHNSSLIKMNNDDTNIKKSKLEKEKEKGGNSYITIFTNKYSDKKKFEEIMKKIFKEKFPLLGFGKYGEIWDIGDGLIAKKEKCNVTYDNSEEFIENEMEKIELSKPLLKANLIPKIYQVNVFSQKGDEYCIEIMDKIEGETVESQLQDLLQDLNLESDEDDTTEYDSILISIKKILISVVNSIIEFHKVMKSSGHDIGHGDLHLENIMIEENTGKVKFIDLSFHNNLSIDEDWNLFLDEALHPILIERYQRDKNFFKNDKLLSKEFRKKSINRLKRMIKDLKKIYDYIENYYEEEMP